MKSCLNDTLDQMILINIYRAFHPKAAQYTFSLSVPGTFSRIDHILSHKSRLGKFRKIEIISRIFSDHKNIRLDTSYRKQTSKKKKNNPTNTWMLSNMLLNNQKVNEEIKEEI